MKTLRIGLLGFGTVGKSLVRLIEQGAADRREKKGLDLVVVAIGNRRVGRKREAWVAPGVRWTEDLESLVRDPGVDAVVELLGGPEPAGGLLRAAIDAGKHVVTANKLLLAREGEGLARRAAERGVALGIEASVAGGIPILRALRESFAGDRIVSVGGILNGTCNFILTEMATRGGRYLSILEEAQRLGYAEADPTSDVEGWDAAYKLALLSRLAFGEQVEVDDVAREGITSLEPCDVVYGRQLGRTLRQIAMARRTESGRLLLSVRTHLVSNASLLARVEGPFNAVEVVGEAGGPFVFHGRGAGGDPTATAVLSDLVEIARAGGRPPAPTFGFEALPRAAIATAEEFVSPFCLRFVVKDRPGIIAAISQVLSAHAINIDAVFQAPWDDKEALPFVVTLERVSKAKLDAACAEMKSFDFLRSAPLALPMTG
ncbi:MAG TPA: homoserine dehydrogenase [Thermoanaerobaculia bacterium]|nr:homoserine dehydrogenase [Thermoanaerobaculia bacterium]HQR66948.1 homoserine dehydrogenase [Thermoanaerobaculia bacterium]